MILSHACIYAIQTLVYTASQDVPGYVSTRLAAEELQIPFEFITKVMQTLTENGLILSKRGATGGIMLALPADEISLLDVIAAIDGLDLFQSCILGLPGAGTQRLVRCMRSGLWSANGSESILKQRRCGYCRSIRIFSYRISTEDFKEKILQL